MNLKINDMIVEVYKHKGYTVDLETGVIYGLKGQELKPCMTHNSYFTVTVQNKRKKVHRLVLMTATQNEGIGLQVNHIDGDKSNNKASNLEWCSAKSNTNHAENLGLRCHNNTITRKDRKLSDKEVLVIRRLLDEGKSSKDIISFCPKANYKNIYAIKNNLSYKLIKTTPR